MASILKVDSLQSTAGVTRNSILQVVSVYNTDYISQAFSANVDTNMTNMSVTITPTSSSSKILLQAQWFGEFSAQTQVYQGMFGFRRGSTQIGEPTSTGSTNAGPKGIQSASINYYNSDAASTGEMLFMQYIDNPATTSAITYYTTFGCGSAVTLKSGGVYSWNTSRTNSYERGTYSMYAMEIAG